MEKSRDVPSSTNPPEPTKTSNSPMAEDSPGLSEKASSTQDAESSPAVEEEAYQYVTGFKLFTVMICITLVAFLIMLDQSIIATVREIS